MGDPTPPGVERSEEVNGGGRPAPSLNFSDSRSEGKSVKVRVGELERPGHFTEAYWWLLHGRSTGKTAKQFGVTERTIYAWKTGEQWLEYFKQEAGKAMAHDLRTETERMAKIREDNVKALELLGAKVKEKVLALDSTELSAKDLLTALKLAAQCSGILEEQVVPVSRINISVQDSEKKMKAKELAGEA